MEVEHAGCPLNSHWLVDEKRGVRRFTPLTTGFYDDIWYTISRPLYFYQKDIIGWNEHCDSLVGIHSDDHGLPRRDSVKG